MPLLTLMLLFILGWFAGVLTLLGALAWLMVVGSGLVEQAHDDQ